MNRALTAVFNRLKRRILARKMIAWKADAGKVTRSGAFLRDFRKTLGEAMAPNARRIFIGTAEFNLGVGIDVDMAVINASVVNFTKTYTTMWLAELEATTRDRLRAAVVSWQQGGLGTQGLPDLVQAIEPLFGKGRAARIAQTETTRVFDLGNKASHESAGIEEEEWQTAQDDLVRPEHQALHGKVFKINKGPRPSDFVNCRCARTPRAKKDG